MNKQSNTFETSTNEQIIDPLNTENVENIGLKSEFVESDPLEISDDNTEQIKEELGI